MHTKLISVCSSVKVVILPIIKFFSSFADFGRTLYTRQNIPVVTSRSLKWHLVRFRDFWSENSKKGYLSLPEKSLFQLFGPFFKILSSRKKYNCHFYQRYANCWFWFYWQPMKVSTFVDIWSKVRCVCRTNPRSNVWLLAYTTVFKSLFSAPLVSFRSFFFVKLWSLFGPF